MKHAQIYAPEAHAPVWCGAQPILTDGSIGNVIKQASMAFGVMALLAATLYSNQAWAVNVVSVVADQLMFTADENQGPGTDADTEADGRSLSRADSVSWQEVGRGEMSLLWFDLYRASLFTPSGEYQAQSYPIKLDIRYLREIEAVDLVDATVEQWQHLGYQDKDIARWQRQLVGLWPDVSEGQSLAFECLSADFGSFSFNGKPLGTITEPGFARAFIDIWLSEQTSRPDLRAQLTGEAPCDC